ncbi:SurA N-terminal domain-containing protein [Pseudahrensia aquimaris]|uniref:Parvulin-like PPIase n=1 Tax=Pseudahrensia aquimaris TaxID=744461 RepID=A0ABW3FJU4_9HYPH
MLASLRNFVGGWTAKILLVLLVASFAVWGISGSILGDANSNTVASVGDTDVPVADYVATYNRNLNLTSRQIGRALTQEQARMFGVEQRTLTDVITAATLDEFSREMNMSLSDDMLAKMLAENEAFQSADGRFDRFAFQNAVRQAGLREADYIRLQNGNAIRSQVMAGIAEGQLLPKVFANALAAYAEEERKFNYIEITSALAGEPAAPTDAQIEEYFTANKSNYAAPEYRKIAILPLEPQSITDEAAITDEQIKADYEARIAAYSTPEKRRVQQIVLSQEKAEEAKKSLGEGATFETVLADNNVKPEDADLGLVEKATLPQAFQDIAFSLEPNEVSDIIAGPFGPSLLRVTEIQKANTRPLEEVSADIRKELALSAAADRVVQVQTEMEDIRAGGATLEEAANQLQLTFRVVETVDARGRDGDGNLISDLPISSQLLRRSFSTEVGEQTSPLEYKDIGSVWYDVLEITPARDRTLDEVKDRVRNDWLAVERSKQAQTKADSLKARLEGGATMADLAAELGTEAKTTAFLKRLGKEPSFPEAATIAGFSGDDKTIAIADGVAEGSKILLQVASVKRPEAQISQPIQNEVEQANLGAANDLLEQLIANLQTSYTVTFNPELMQRALTQR